LEDLFGPWPVLRADNGEPDSPAILIARNTIEQYAAAAQNTNERMRTRPHQHQVSGRIDRADGPGLRVLSSIWLGQRERRTEPSNRSLSLNTSLSETRTTTANTR